LFLPLQNVRRSGYACLKAVNFNPRFIDLLKSLRNAEVVELEFGMAKRWARMLDAKKVLVSKIVPAPCREFPRAITMNILGDVVCTFISAFPEKQ